MVGAGCSSRSQSLSTKNANVNKSVRQPTPQDTSLDITTWQSFSDPASGFSFKYPSNWNVLSTNTSYTVCLAENSASQSCDIGINIVKAPDERHPAGVLSNEDLIKALEKKYASQTIGKDLKVVNGLHTAKYSVAEETQIFIETTTYDYILAMSQHDPLGKIRGDYTKISQVLSLLATTVSVSKKW